MKAYILLLMALVALCRPASAQDTIKGHDQVYTLSGDVYEGTITQESKGQYLIIRTNANKTYNLPYEMIKRVFYAPGTHSTQPGQSVVMAGNSDTILKRGFGGSTGKGVIPEKLLTRRNTGAGFTVIGIAAMATSVILLSTATWRTYSTGYSSGVSSSDPQAVVGGLMIPLSIGMIIPGSIIWGISNRKIKNLRY